MALSYSSNWEMGSDIAIADPELRALPQAWNYDCFYEPNDFFYAENPNSLLPDGVPYDHLNSIVTDPFLLQQELKPFHYPKRLKGCDFEQIYSDQSNYFSPAFFNGFVPNPCLLQDYSPPETAVPPPLLDFPPGYAAGSCDSMKKEASVGSLSSQSIAARQRRRRITEKTQELGKLVPGGQKMNTAEMLQAAYKYIKYLQAQVGVLEFISLNNQETAEAPLEELELLLESPLIQEKLYSTENCLVPHKVVDDEIIKSNSHLLSSLNKD